MVFCCKFSEILILLYLQEKQQKRAEEAKSAGPAKTAAEATRRMLVRKVTEQTGIMLLENLEKMGFTSIGSFIDDKP